MGARSTLALVCVVATATPGATATHHSAVHLGVSGDSMRCVRCGAARGRACCSSSGHGSRMCGPCRAGWCTAALHEHCQLNPSLMAQAAVDGSILQALRAVPHPQQQCVCGAVCHGTCMRGVMIPL
jgi:hypothetical protein